jgi:4-diphosphocytidyl-2-C-methyl-D-erythritol kinase
MNAAFAKSPIPSQTRSLRIISYAKLNLFLDVLGKRADGYHELETLFERITLADTLILTELTSDEIVVSSSCRDLPTDEKNLATQAASLLKESLGIQKGVKIEIQKNIPIGAGLAGGSSNAAAVLLGLTKLFGLKLSKKTLISYANRLGSDVAFFVFNARFALGKGRGNELKAVPMSKTIVLWHILFVPFAPVMTKDVYRLLDEDARREKSSKSLKKMETCAKNRESYVFFKDKKAPTNMLTKKRYDVNILISYLKNRNADSLNQNIYNRLSETVMKSYRFVSVLKSDLKKFGLKYVHMSGSGPTLFTTFKRKEEAEKLYGALKDRFSDRCSVFLVSTQ